jgi:hypothetical protein
VGSDIHLFLLCQPGGNKRQSQWRLVPTVVFQEFSSEERCKDAKSKIEATLKHAGDRLKSGLEDLQKAGAADPAQIIIAYNVECLAEVNATQRRRLGPQQRPLNVEQQAGKPMINYPRPSIL